MQILRITARRPIITLAGQRMAPGDELARIKTAHPEQVTRLIGNAREFWAVEQTAAPATAPADGVDLRARIADLEAHLAAQPASPAQALAQAILAADDALLLSAPAIGEKKLPALREWAAAQLAAATAADADPATDDQPQA